MLGLQNRARIPFTKVELEAEQPEQLGPKSRCFTMPIGFTACNKWINTQCAIDVHVVRERHQKNLSIYLSMLLDSGKKE